MTMARKSPYPIQAAVNDRLRQGERLSADHNESGLRIGVKSGGAGGRPLHYPRIGVYAGKGTSHSWLWFVEIFDRMGFHDIRILDDGDIRRGQAGRLDVLAVSGGDTFAVAQGLGPDGAGRMRSFIEAGGLYMGSCAGAYLVMNSSKPHLNDFNFTAVKITNLSKYLPDCRRLEHKFAMAYGCDYVFHPVRETVRLKTTHLAPFGPAADLNAPLYGGPGMVAPPEADVLARYDGFTGKTDFLVERRLAEDTLTGNAAAVRARLGNGAMVLFGPHFEHPRYTAANIRIADTIYWDGCRKAPGDRRRTADATRLSAAAARGLVNDLKRELSNARIVASGLEMNPVRWLIGSKTYEPEKIRVFLEAMWRCIHPLEKTAPMDTAPEDPETLSRYAGETTQKLRELKGCLDRADNTVGLAGTLFDLLHRYAKSFFNFYFNTKCITN